MTTNSPEKQHEYYLKYYQKRGDYAREKSREQKRKMREWITEYKSTLKCERCPENHTATLQFHHLDETQKEYNIFEMAGTSMSKLQKEIAKCIVLCANCHFKHHWKEKETN